MRGNGAPFPLFDERSTSVFSPVFLLSPGRMALFQAFGFPEDRREVEDGKPWAAPTVCLRQILYHSGDTVEEADLYLEEAIGIYLAGRKGAILAEGPVRTRGCTWNLSACNNIALLDVPGNYRLELNDPASVGEVQVYIRALSADDMLRRSSRLYLGEED